MRTDTDMENKQQSCQISVERDCIFFNSFFYQTRAQMRYCNVLELEVTERARKPSTLTERAHVAWKRKMDVQPNETKTP